MPLRRRTDPPLAEARKNQGLKYAKLRRLGGLFLRSPLLFVAEILLMRASLGDELEQAAAGVEVLFVLLQMSGQFVNPLG